MSQSPPTTAFTQTSYMETLQLLMPGNQLRVNFGIKPDSSMQPWTIWTMANGCYNIAISNMEFSQPDLRLRTVRVKSVVIKVNDFVEYDPYEFVKK